MKGSILIGRCQEGYEMLILLQMVYCHNSKRLQTLASEREETADTEITKHCEKCEQEVGSLQWTGALQPRRLCSGRNQVWFMD